MSEFTMKWFFNYDEGRWTALYIAKKRGTSQALLDELEKVGYYNAKPGPECIGQGFEVKAIKPESEATP